MQFRAAENNYYSIVEFDYGLLLNQRISPTPAARRDDPLGKKRADPVRFARAPGRPTRLNGAQQIYLPEGN